MVHITNIIYVGKLQIIKGTFGHLSDPKKCIEVTKKLQDLCHEEAGETSLMLGCQSKTKPPCEFADLNDGKASLHLLIVWAIGSQVHLHHDHSLPNNNPTHSLSLLLIF